MNTREWATPGDKRIPKEQLPNEHHSYFGDHPSESAIGGYFGIAWYEYFQDSKTREIYKVRCCDGVYRNRGAWR